MKDKLTKTCLIAVATTCVLGTLVQPVAAESYWCKMFPKFCSDEGTPGGTQNAPEAPAGAQNAPAMSPEPYPAAPSTDAAQPAPPPEPAETPPETPPASPAPAAPSP